MTGTSSSPFLHCSQREQFETHGQPRVLEHPGDRGGVGGAPWEAHAEEGVFAQSRVKLSQDPVPGRSGGRVGSEQAEGNSCPAHGHLAVGTLRLTTVHLLNLHQTP